MSTFGQNASSQFSVPNKEDLCVKMTAKHNIRILMSNWTKSKKSLEYMKFLFFIYSHIFTKKYVEISARHSKYDLICE